MLMVKGRHEKQLFAHLIVYHDTMHELFLLLTRVFCSTYKKQLSFHVCEHCSIHYSKPSIHVDKHHNSSKTYLSFHLCAYQFIERSYNLSIDGHYKCRPVNQVSEDHSDSIPHTWRCSSKCKLLTDKELALIFEFNSGIEADLQQVSKLLNMCDDNCPNNHYHKVSLTADESPDSTIVDYCSVECSGQCLLCFTGNECNSKLRMLRAASTHCAVLCSFLHALYDCIRCHRHTAELDAALSSSDFDHLPRACEIDNYNVCSVMKFSQFTNSLFLKLMVLL